MTTKRSVRVCAKGCGETENKVCETCGGTSFLHEIQEDEDPRKPALYRDSKEALVRLYNMRKEYD